MIRLLQISILMFINCVIFAQNFDWTPQNSNVSETLYDVFFVDNQNGWAVGDNGVIINTVDGGQNWNTQSSGVTDVLRAVFFINDTTGWAVGGSLNRTLIKTTDGGLEWQSITGGNFSSNLMYDIAFADIQTGWLITMDSIYITYDGGNTWEKEDYVIGISGPLSHRSIAVTSDTTAYVAGIRKYTGSSKTAEVFHRRPENAPYLWSYTGVNSFDVNDQLRSIAFSSTDTGFAGGEQGIIYRKTGSHPSGPWEVCLDLEPAGFQMIFSISFPSASRGMFNTSTEVDGTTYALIYHTSDNGNSWSSIPDSVPDLLSATLFAPDSENAWLVGVLGKIYKGVPSTVGIGEKVQDLNIRLYPNPATDIITVELISDPSELIGYTFLDVTGRVIKKGSWNSRSSSSFFELDISDFSEGTYLLRLETENRHSVFRISKI